MNAITLTQGKYYNQYELNQVGWSQNGQAIESPEGYHRNDYFDAGFYLGADDEGIEPTFEAETAVAQTCYQAQIARVDGQKCRKANAPVSPMREQAVRDAEYWLGELTSIEDILATTAELHEKGTVDAVDYRISVVEVN